MRQSEVTDVLSFQCAISFSRLLISPCITPPPDRDWETNITDIESFMKIKKQQFIEQELESIKKTAEQIYGSNNVPSDFLKKFKGFMTEPTAEVDNKKLEAKSRRFNSFEELENTDFSDCYLYNIMFICMLNPETFSPLNISNLVMIFLLLVFLRVLQMAYLHLHIE